MFPHLVTATNVPKLVKIGDVNWDDVDAAFCCLPHATTQGTLASLPRHVKVVDLSADFRLRNIDTYAEWYAPHKPHAHTAHVSPYVWIFEGHCNDGREQEGPQMCVVRMVCTTRPHILHTFPFISNLREIAMVAKGREDPRDDMQGGVFLRDGDESSALQVWRSTPGS